MRSRDLNEVPKGSKLTMLFSRFRASAFGNFWRSRGYDDDDDLPSVDYSIPSVDYSVTGSVPSVDYSIPTVDYSVTDYDDETISGKSECDTMSTSSGVGYFRPNLDGNSDESSNDDIENKPNRRVKEEELQ